jgi:hypothetical protein
MEEVKKVCGKAEKDCPKFKTFGRNLGDTKNWKQFNVAQANNQENKERE